MRVKLIIVLAASLVFMGNMLTKEASAGGEETSASKPNIQWTATESEQQQARDSWRKDLSDFQSKVSQREALKARTNESVHQRTEYYVN